MFTGLIKAIGEIVATEKSGGGKVLTVDLSGLSAMPEIGASIALSGACQTVIAIRGKTADFFASPETLARTTLGTKKRGDYLNLEPALRIGDPLDGHLVSGHIDLTTTLLAITPAGGSQIWRFALLKKIAPLIAEKGSVTLDGISLTVATVAAESFTISVIPHTLTQTTMDKMRVGERVNLEVDILARYLARQMELGKPAAAEFYREDFVGVSGF